MAIIFWYITGLERLADAGRISREKRLTAGKEPKRKKEYLMRMHTAATGD